MSMKHRNTVDADARLDALLAEMPVSPSADFSRRVCAAIREEALDAALAAQPVVPAADFSSRVIASLESKNVVQFPSVGKKLMRFARFAAAGTAAVLALSFGFVSLSEKSLDARVARALESDPELAQLVAADDDPFSFNEAVEASRLLTMLNEKSADAAEFFAYYEN